MKRVPLSKGKFAVVSDCDYAKVISFSAWYYHRSGNKRTGYAYSCNKSKISMHRFLMGDPANQVDHRDEDGLNNTRGNLRLGNVKLNAANRRKFRGTYSSNFKGVCWDGSRAKWEAHITVNYKKKHLGRFVSERQAALAYNRAAVNAFGQFAKLNCV